MSRHTDIIRLWSVALALVLASATGALQAQTRRALVIGNSDYQFVQKLKNPANDAELMAQVLAKGGFQVQKETNLTRPQMKEAFRRFRAAVNKDDAVAIYYSGHGIQVRGQNYLIPVDFNAKYEYEVESEAVDLQILVHALEDAQAGLSMVFLDCCRDTPGFLTGESRSLTRGLAALDMTGDMMVCYATKHGRTAADNPELPNSIYASALASELPVAGRTVEAAMKAVNNKVYQATNKAQEPFIYGQLRSTFYFSPSAEPDTGAAAEPVPTRNAGDTIAAATPQTANSDPSTQDLPATLKTTGGAAEPTYSQDSEVRKLVNTFIKNLTSNDPQVYVSSFATSVDYCYKEDGPAGTAFIKDDVDKFIRRYPEREYEMIDGPTIKMLKPGELAEAHYSFRYRYSGPKKVASGKCKTDLVLRKGTSRWYVTSYKEAVERD